MKLLCYSFTFAIVLCPSIVLSADVGERDGETALSSKDSRANTVQMDARFLLSPFGEITGGTGTISAGVDTEVAYGVAGHLAYRVSEFLSLGFAPQYITDITPDMFAPTMSTSSQFDLLARVTGYVPVTSIISLVGYAAPGLSMIRGETDENGFVVAGGVGLLFEVSPGFDMMAELGYQKAFFQVNGGDLDTSFVVTSVGVGTHF